MMVLLSHQFNEAFPTELSQQWEKLSNDQNPLTIPRLVKTCPHFWMKHEPAEWKKILQHDEPQIEVSIL